VAAGDGAPDPETTAVDEVWYVGQKAVTHYIEVEHARTAAFPTGTIVTIHVNRCTTYGVDGGVNPLDGRTIHRRVVSTPVDNTTRLGFVWIGLCCLTTTQLSLVQATVVALLLPCTAM